MNLFIQTSIHGMSRELIEHQRSASMDGWMDGDIGSCGVCINAVVYYGIIDSQPASCCCRSNSRVARTRLTRTVSQLFHSRIIRTNDARMMRMRCKPSSSSSGDPGNGDEIRTRYSLGVGEKDVISDTLYRTALPLWEVY